MVLCLAHCQLSANFLEVWKDNVQNQTSTFMNTYRHKNTINWTQTLEGTVVSRISSDFLSDDFDFQSWRLSSSTCSRNVWPSRVLWLQWQVWTNFIDEQPGEMCYYVAHVSFEIVLVNDTLWTFFNAQHFHTFMHRQSRFGKPHASYYFKQQSVPKGFVFMKQGEKTNDSCLQLRPTHVSTSLKTSSWS